MTCPVSYQIVWESIKAVKSHTREKKKKNLFRDSWSRYGNASSPPWDKKKKTEHNQSTGRIQQDFNPKQSNTALNKTMKKHNNTVAKIIKKENWANLMFGHVVLFFFFLKGVLLTGECVLNED